MKHKNAKLAAYALVGVLAVGGVCVNVDATGVSSLLPAAGLALTMEEGSSQEEVASAKDVTPAQAKEKKNNSGKKTGSTTAGKSASGTENKEKTARDVNEKSKEKEAPANTETSAKETEKNAAEEEKEKLSQEEKAFSKLVIAKVNDYVNIRSIPSEEGEILGKLYDKSVGDFIEEENGWYKIKSGTVTGYVKGEYCVTGEEAVALAKEVGTRVATVTTTTLKVREAESTDAPVLGLVPIDEELSVVDELD